MFGFGVAFTFLLPLTCWLGSVSAAPSPLTRRARVCNGNAALCNRRYDNVSFVGAHDSYAVDTDPFDLSANQNYDVTRQLNDGVRLLQGQAHWINNDHLELCHTNCALYDGGSLVSYLTKVKTWLDANPNEVITLLWVNSDDRPPSDWAAAYAATGMDHYSYAPASAPVKLGSWPTLGQLIDSGKRAVTFVDYAADESVVNYLLEEFTQVWETPYDQTSTSFPCTVDRIGGDNNPATHMYLINHYLDVSIAGILIPDRANAAGTNSGSGEGNLLADAQNCAATYGHYPNFLLLDFYDQGTPFAVAKTLNGFA